MASNIMRSKSAAVVELYQWVLLLTAYPSGITYTIHSPTCCSTSWLDRCYNVSREIMSMAKSMDCKKRGKNTVQDSNLLHRSETENQWPVSCFCRCILNPCGEKVEHIRKINHSANHILSRQQASYDLD